MTARLASLLPRLAALTIIGLLAASSITFAAARKTIEQKDAEAPPVQQGPKTLVVPDVRHQAYVFAKGMLEDAGFAWRVSGPVKGFAANTVSVQKPAPGTVVIDTGMPTIKLRLERNDAYAERGLPENTSPYPGTPLRLASPPAHRKADAKAGDEKKRDEKPAKPEKPAKDAKGDSGARKPDFVVPKAPKEPTDEMPLPDRARLLERRLAAAPKPTRKLVSWWLYQQSWLVTGAKFGWHDGAEALRILVRVDRSLQDRWGFGAKSATEAEQALAEVERKAAE